jgi:hypothetical protein
MSNDRAVAPHRAVIRRLMHLATTTTYDFVFAFVVVGSIDDYFFIVFVYIVVRRLMVVRQRQPCAKRRHHSPTS